MTVGHTVAVTPCLTLTLAPLFQVNEAAEIMYDLVDPEANLIFGAVVDPSMTDEVSITLIATGFSGATGAVTRMGGRESEGGHVALRGSCPEPPGGRRREASREV